MAKRKRSIPLSAASNSSTISANNPGLAIANKRRRKSAPIDKILNIPELCEQVLSHLPLYELLHATQVCLTFKANIENSPRLQKTLYLVADMPRPRLAISSSGTLLSGTRAEQHIAAAEATGAHETGQFTCCILHPALELDPQSHRRLASTPKRMGMVGYAAQRFDPSDYFTTDDVVVRKSILLSTKNGSKAAGLDGMLIAQPPVTSVVVFVVFDFGDYRVCFHKAAGNAAGVTFGDVFGTVAGIEQEHWRKRMRTWWISFDRRSFVVSDEAREAVEKAEELSSEEDPTRWVPKNGEYVLQEGGFEF